MKPQARRLRRTLAGPLLCPLALPVRLRLVTRLPALGGSACREASRAEGAWAPGCLWALLLRSPAPFLLALNSVSVPAVILGELQTPSRPPHRLQKRSKGVLPAGGKGVCFHLLDPVEDGALRLPSGLCSSGCCGGGACQGGCQLSLPTGRSVSDFRAWCFWLQEHRMWVVRGLAACVLLGSSVMITGQVLWQPCGI